MLNTKSLIFLLLLSIFLVSLIPINDYDFWWHLKTGDYILENKRLPDTDPFSYTAVSIDRDDPLRQPFILKQYWLAQVIFALIVKGFGLKGFIIMRAIVFALIGFIVLSFHRLDGPLSPIISYISPATLLLLTLITTECLTDRPQMFSFLFAIVLIFLLERYMLHHERFPLYTLPFLMFFWSQMHGGFSVGVLYLVVYLFTMSIEGRVKRRRDLLIAILISILVTYLNPSHWQVFRELALEYIYGGSVLHGDVLEHRSPFKVFSLTIKNPGWISYWVLTVFSLIALVRLFIRRSWSRLLILAGTMIASLVAMRYIYFFAPVAAAILPSIFNYQSKFSIANLKFKMNIIILSLILVFTLIFTYNKVNFNGLLKSEIAPGFFPEQATDYILSKGIPQPLFNDVSWGGYLIYRLWPRYKIFSDTRTINIDTYRQYMNVINWTVQGKSILDVYGIKSIITPALNPYTGEIFPVVRGLMNDNEWLLIYLDGVAMIFVRKGYTRDNIYTPLPKSAIYQQAFYEIIFWRHAFPSLPGYRRTMEEIQRAFGSESLWWRQLEAN